MVKASLRLFFPIAKSTGYEVFEILSMFSILVLPFASQRINSDRQTLAVSFSRRLRKNVNEAGIDET